MFVVQKATNDQFRPNFHKKQSPQEFFEQLQRESRDFPKVLARSLKMNGEIENNFVGKAHYYHLDREENQKQVQGEYIVVYSAPLGDSGAFRELYEGLAFNKFEVYTVPHLRAPEDKMPPEFESLINSSNDSFGVGHLQFGKQMMRVNLRYPPPDDMTRSLIGIRQWDSPLAVETGTRLELLLRMGVQGGTSSISFGRKEIADELHQSKRYTMKWGYEFAELELQVFDIATMCLHIQQIVAVKLPENYKDVSSASLLKQRLFYVPKDETISTVFNNELSGAAQSAMSVFQEPAREGPGGTGLPNNANTWIGKWDNAQSTKLSNGQNAHNEEKLFRSFDSSPNHQEKTEGEDENSLKEHVRGSASTS
ncbi:hypothetical protein G7Y89_g7600 [Cudoniella acicularis]|uniref:Uncharacterized protein n=1 Tax=Cudoniella acicularis TaxID=354080 RepID=A0A8H4W1W9_9HELO|nr:hypothetical protein G7Y89_g7600 [Cudoniella acicularis]